MLKNFLWFTREPADERETEIFSRAYRRALFALWYGLIALWFIGFVLNEPVVPPFLTLADVSWLLLLSVVAGWTVVRKESLEYRSVHLKKQPLFRHLLLVALAIMTISFLVLWFAPSLYVVVVFSDGIISWLAAMTWCWFWTRGYSLPARILGTFLLPLQIIGFLLRPKAKVWQRVLISIAIFVITYGFIGGAFVLAVQETTVSPIIVATEVFEPSLPSGEWVLIDSRDGQSLSVGDFVVVMAVGGQPILHEVIAVEDDLFTIRNSSAEATVPRDEIAGKVIQEFPLKGFMNRLIDLE